MFFKSKKVSNETNAQYDAEKPSIDVDGETESLVAENNMIQTTLSYHPEWNVEQNEKYVFQFHHNQLNGMERNQISVNGIKLTEAEDSFVATAFIRNTLSNAIRFDALTLLLLNSEEQVVAKRTFEMHHFGELDSLHCRPWRFLFSKDDLKDGARLPVQDFKLAFEIKQKQQSSHRLELADSWKQNLNAGQKNEINELVGKLPPLKKNEVNLMGIQAEQKNDDSLHVMILIRNGSDKNIKLEKLPLTIEDAHNKIIAKGLFELEDFQIRANTSKPWSFIFPPELVKENEIDLTRWKAYSN
ncbi:accessory Sec system S-layer assembly protein [Pseudalkalibacillus sp. R45]|uniref:accessory Sec system S-layer assembly protein n=1 Tax=Pseudalkalibacillus sp. R45 TaxID=3457433 RepID=UPI003FCC54C1